MLDRDEVALSVEHAGQHREYEYDCASFVFCFYFFSTVQSTCAFPNGHCSEAPFRVTRNGNGFSVSPMLADACCRAPVFPVFLTPFAVAIAVVSGYFNAPRNEAVEDPAASNCGAIGWCSKRAKAMSRREAHGHNFRYWSWTRSCFKFNDANGCWRCRWWRRRRPPLDWWKGENGEKEEEGYYCVTSVRVPRMCTSHEPIGVGFFVCLRVICVCPRRVGWLVWVAAQWVSRFGGSRENCMESSDEEEMAHADHGAPASRRKFERDGASLPA